MTLSSFCTHIGTKQSVGGAKNGVPGENHLAQPQAELSLSHIHQFPMRGANPQPRGPPTSILIYVPVNHSGNSLIKLSTYLHVDLPAMRCYMQTICLPVGLSASPPVFMSICLSVDIVLRYHCCRPVSACRPVCLSTSLFVYVLVGQNNDLMKFPTICLSTCLHFDLSACRPVCMSTCLHVDLSGKRPDGLSTCLHVDLSTCRPVCMSTCLRVDLSTGLCTCRPVCLSTCQAIDLTACRPVCMSTCMSTCLHVDLSGKRPDGLSTCLHVDLSACRPVCMSTCLHVDLSICLCMPVYLSTCLHVDLSACRPVCVSTCLPVCVPVDCLPVDLSGKRPDGLSTCLHVDLSACRPVYMSTCLYVDLSICLCVCRPKY